MEHTEFTDEQIERLLAGQDSDEFGSLGVALAALRNIEAPEIAVGPITKSAVAVAIKSAPHGVRVDSATSPSFFSSLRQRAAAIAVGATVMLSSTGGLAVAADGAKPGDFLYGVDRALETIGIGNGNDIERLEEAQALINAGDVPRGLRHAAEAVEREETENGASAALLDAADRVRSGRSEQSAATREQVATLLTYISENAGSIDGQQVAELAREIGAPEADNPSGPSVDTPTDPPGRADHAPGPPDHAPGPPEDSPADPPGHAEDKPGKPPKKDK